MPTASPAPILVLGGIILMVAIVALIVYDDEADPVAHGEGPYGATDAGAVGTGSDEVEGASVATLNTVLSELRTAGGPADLTELVGRRLSVQVDIGRALNDVAFWTGSPPYDLLVVTSRDTRSGSERQMGKPSAHTLNPPPRGVVTLHGVVEKIPHAEAMFSWHLSRRDAALLAERGVYVRAYEIAASTPRVPGEHEPEEIIEWSRETAPPPGEQNVTPLGLPPPPP